MRGPMSHVESIIRNGNVALLNLRSPHVAMFISRKCHVPCAMSL